MLVVRYSSLVMFCCYCKYSKFVSVARSKTYMFQIRSACLSGVLLHVLDLLFDPVDRAFDFHDESADLSVIGLTGDGVGFS